MFLIKLSQRCTIFHLYILLAVLIRDEGGGGMMSLSETFQGGDRCNTGYICYILSR